MSWGYVTCTYDEVRLFKGSAADSGSNDPSPIGSADDGLIQTIADNFDEEIASPNGLTSAHSVATLHPLDALKGTMCSGMSTSVYKGPKKPSLPPKMAEKGIIPLKVLAKQILSVERSKSLDFDFFKVVTSQNSSPEFGGFNNAACTERRKRTESKHKNYVPATD